MTLGCIKGVSLNNLDKPTDAMQSPPSSCSFPLFEDIFDEALFLSYCHQNLIKHVFRIRPQDASFEVPSCSAHGAQFAILSGPTAANQSMSVLFAITLLGNGALFRVIVVDHTSPLPWEMIFEGE